MVRLILIGLLSGFFFSSTFVLNRIMSLSGGHWVWSASLRYAYMILLLTIWLLVFRGTAAFARTLGLFFTHLAFWVAAGSIGFGAFYALICFSADYAPGWVVATTWQFTIMATLVVLTAFGRRFPRRIWLFSAIVFAGVFLVNLSQAGAVDPAELIKGALPVLIAAFCYPIGNQLVWEAKTGHGRLPDISGPELEHPFAKVLLMSLGSVPFWSLLVVVTAPPPPVGGQIVNTALVALFSGCDGHEPVPLCEERIENRQSTGRRGRHPIQRGDLRPGRGDSDHRCRTAQCPGGVGDSGHRCGAGAIC